MPRWRNADALVLGTSAFGRGGSSPSRGTRFSRKALAAWAATGFETRDSIPERDGGSTPQLSAKLGRQARIGRAPDSKPGITEFESLVSRQILGEVATWHGKRFAKPSRSENLACARSTRALSAKFGRQAHIDWARRSVEPDLLRRRSGFNSLVAHQTRRSAAAPLVPVKGAASRKEQAWVLRAASIGRTF
jgi:hypothetical protein